MVDPQMTEYVLSGIRDGDSDAAEIVWQQYFAKLVQFARQKLASRPLRSSDEDDVVQSVMISFCRGMKAGKFDWLDSRNDLWKLLATMTRRKVCKHRRREMAGIRGGGQVRGESAFIRPDASDDRELGIGDVAGDAPTPEEACMLVENVEQMLDCLAEDQLREIALLALDGDGTAEIARKLNCSQRAVQRKLERIRSKWTRKGLA